MLSSFENKLKDKYQNAFYCENGHFFLKDMGESLYEVINELKNKYGFIVLVATHELSDDRVAIQLSNLEFHKRIFILCKEQDLHIKNINDLFPMLNWYKSSCTPRDFSQCPFPRDYTISEEEELAREYLNLGPISPLTLNLAKCAVELDGETIKRFKIATGYHRTGIESSICKRNFLQLSALLENYYSPMSLEMSFLVNHTLETMLGLNISLRAKAIRMVMLELARIGGHFANFERIFSTLGLSLESHFVYGLKNSVHELFGHYNHSQYGEGVIKLGGLVHDLPVGWIARCLNTLSLLGQKVSSLKNNLTNSTFWMSKTETYKVHAQDALSFGFSGPSLRSTGVNYDLRKAAPFYLYDEVQFDIPLGIDGTNYDRFLVRLEEVNQSIRIILQILDNMPQGDYLVGPMKEWKKLKADGQRSEYIEAVSKGLSFNEGIYYSSFESTHGELGLLLEVKEGESSPYSLSLNLPGRSFLCALEKLLVESSYTEISTSIASFGIEGKEVDK